MQIPEWEVIHSMANARFFRVAVLGGYVDDSEWASESWQYGFTLIANTDTSLPNRDVIKAPMPNCEVLPSSAIVSSAGWTRYYGFEGTAGNAMTTSAQTLIQAALTNHYDAIKTYLTTDHLLKAVKITAYGVGANGKPEVINGSTVMYKDVPSPGTAATWRMPPQCASVISLQSGAKGPAGRGRAYIPCCGATLAVDGLLGSAERTALLNAQVSLGQGLAANAKALMVVCNQYQFTYSGIATYRVGNHVDTQRRRAKGVNETYDSVAALF